MARFSAALPGPKKKEEKFLTSDEVTKEVSFRKQLLERGLLLVLRGSKEMRGIFTG